MLFNFWNKNDVLPIDYLIRGEMINDSCHNNASIHRSNVLQITELGKYGLSRVRVQRKSYSKTKISNTMTLKYVFNAIVV